MNIINKLINEAEKTKEANGAKIEFRNVGKKYEGRTEYTLKDIDITINGGEFCVILGPSGCGKTTLLRMIAGLNSITKGDLLFDNYRVNDLEPGDRDIAMVFQSYALYPHMNVYKNIAFGLQNQKIRNDVIDIRVKQAAKMLQITNRLYDKPKDLSGGQRQRVAIARAIVRKPAIFLMDEPLSNLDAKLRESTRREIVQIHKMLGSTFVYVTHDQLEAMTMADKIILMNNSIIQQIGTPYELYSKPANLFVAKFIGSPTMNIFEGSIINNHFISKNQELKIALDCYEIGAEYEDQEIFLGIRSEAFIHSLDHSNIDLYVMDVEFVGKEKTLTTSHSSSEGLILCSVPNWADVKEGQVQKFLIKRDELFFFDKATEKAIDFKHVKRLEVNEL